MKIAALLINGLDRKRKMTAQPVLGPSAGLVSELSHARACVKYAKFSSTYVGRWLLTYNLNLQSKRLGAISGYTIRSQLAPLDGLDDA